MSDRQFVPALHGLRAIAVALVILMHNGQGWVGGHIGVDIFFVLSGYLITSGIASREVSLLRFYWHRFIRLSPAFAVLLSAYALVVSIWSPQHLLAHAHAVFYAGTYLMNWNLVFTWGPTGYLAHTWSLAIEEQFYLLWAPFLLVLAAALSRRQTIAIVVACIVASALWRAGLSFSGESYYRTYHGFDTRADGLLLGCLLALWKPEGIGAFAARSWPVPAAVIAWVAWSVPAGSLAMDRGLGFLVSLMAAWIVGALVSRGTMLGRILSIRPLVIIGSISYGLYLWHWPLLGLAREAGWEQPALIATLGAIVISAVSYRFVEAPLRRRLRDWSPFTAISSSQLPMRQSPRLDTTD